MKKIIKETLKEVGTCLIRSIYNRPYKQKIRPMGESLTQQQFTDEQNVNTIMKKYARTGIIGTGLGTRTPQFGNYENQSFHEMETKLAQSVETFQNLPSAVRKRFDNNVGNLLDFIDDKSNYDEAVKMGLIPEPEKPETAPSAVPEPPADPPPKP